MLQIKCPHCPQVTQIAEALTGKTVRCGSCKKVFKVEPVIDLPNSNGIEGTNEAERSHAAQSENAVNEENLAQSNFFVRVFVNPETKDTAILIAVCITIIFLGVLWFQFGYLAPLIALATAGAVFGVFVWLKNRATTDVLKFCPSCGTKWSESNDQCEKCTWDYRTRQYSDPAKALRAKQPAPVPGGLMPDEKHPAAQFELQEAVKTCPFCGEKILQVASVCKHCHTNLLSPNQRATLESAPPYNAHMPAYRGERSRDDDTPATSICTTLGFIFSAISLLCWPLGVVAFPLAIVGLVQSRNKAYPVFVLLLSVILPAIGMFFGFIFLALFLAWLSQASH